VPLDDGGFDATTVPIDPGIGSCQVDSGPIVQSPSMLGGVCDPCPHDVPINDSPCDAQLVGIECEYGDNDDWFCNSIARCYAGDGGAHWGVGKPPKPCPLVRGGPCPVEKPKVYGCCTGPGDTVPDPDVRCDYGNVYCACEGSGGTSNSNPGWWCTEMPCRGVRARLGCPCADGAGCATCSNPDTPSCINGRWHTHYQSPCK
jgi:hypothetical protein